MSAEVDRGRNLLDGPSQCAVLQCIQVEVVNESTLIGPAQRVGASNDDTSVVPRGQQRAFPVAFPRLVQEVVDQCALVGAVAAFDRHAQDVAVVEVGTAGLLPVGLVDLFDDVLNRIGQRENHRLAYTKLGLLQRDDSALRQEDDIRPRRSDRRLTDASKLPGDLSEAGGGQVAEFVGKLPPDTMAEICYKWGNMYSAFIVIDITGGMGVATSRKLQELGYKDLYVEGEDLNKSWKYNPKSAEKIPGINFNNKRVQIIASYEEALRHDFKIYSHRLYNEMDTFIYINGRPDHQKGRHDDLLMSISMATYVGETSFAKLTKVTEQTKAMLNSWSVNNNDSVTENISFNPVMPNYSERMTQNNTVSRNDYMKYNWLFGGMK